MQRFPGAEDRAETRNPTLNSFLGLRPQLVFLPFLYSAFLYLEPNTKLEALRRPY